MRRATPNFKVERRRSRISTQERRTDLIDPPSPDDTPDMDVHADMDSIRRAEDVLFSKVSPIALRTLSDQSRAKLDTSFHPEEQPAPRVGRILPSLTTPNLDDPQVSDRAKKRQFNALSPRSDEPVAEERATNKHFDALETRQPEAKPEIEAEVSTEAPKPADDERVYTQADLGSLMKIKTFDPATTDEEWQEAAPAEPEPKKPQTLAEIAAQLAPRVKSTPEQIAARRAERQQRIAEAKVEQEVEVQEEPQVNLEALLANQPPIHDRARRLLYNNWMRHHLKKDALAYPDLANRILRPGEQWKQRLPIRLW